MTGRAKGWPRFGPGLAVLGGVVVSWSGFHWDIALHGDIGRERFISTPHLIVVAGMVIQGCAAVWGLFAVAGEVDLRARIRARPGLVLALAAPLVNSVILWFDNRWHELFGLDVTLWSPPHILLVLGFVDAFLGGVIDLAQHRFAPVGLALVTGSLFGLVTIVNFEFDIGYPHFAIRWVAPVMAFMLLGILTLSSTLSGVRWAGLLLVPGTLVLRVFGLLVNSLAHRSLPTLPIGLLAGAVAYDLLRRGRPADARPGPVVVAGTWVIAFSGQYLWLLLAGKTWWRPSDILPGLLAGLVAALGAAYLGSALGRSIRATTDPATPVIRSSPVRYAAVVLVTSGLLFLTGVPLLTQAAVADRNSVVNVTGRRVELVVEGASSDDWVSVFSRKDDVEGIRWASALDWEDGRFVGDVPDPALTEYLAYWYVDRTRPFIGVTYGSGSSAQLMSPEYFTPALPSSASSVIVSLALVVVLLTGITAPLRFALTTRPT